MNAARTCVIFQPTYLPWAGYFDLIDSADEFILLDSVQFEKQSWQQRNRIRAFDGLEWLTVPVRIKGRFGQKINEVELSNPEFFRAHLRAIELHYRRAPHFERYFGGLRAVIESASEAGSLSVLNARLIAWLCAQLGVTTPVRLASEMQPEGRRSAMLIDLCGKAGASRYLSTAGAWEYLREDLQLFDDAGIELQLHDYRHPEYRQVYRPFLPYASVLDLLLNEGDAARALIVGGRRPARPARAMPAQP
jgi:hypothetical protein